MGKAKLNYREGRRLKSLRKLKEAREASKRRASEHDRYSTSSEPQTTDHGLVMFMQRVMGVDIKGMREKILSHAVRQHMKLKLKRFNVDGITYVVENNRIITCYKEE